MNIPRTQRLLARTAGRIYFARLGGAFHRGWLVAAGVAVLALLAARLLAILPAEVVVRWLWLPAALAALVALVFTRKPQPRDTARLIDERTGSKDLFLTSALVSDASGEFSPIVLAQAEERSDSLDPRRVLPFAWQRGARDIFLSTAIVAALAMWLPQLDPFKKEAEREKFAKQQQQLEQTKKATAARADQLKQDDAKENEKVKQALAALEKTFKEAKPQEREANLKRLAEQQKQIGELWRQAASERRNDANEQGGQKFGQANPQQVQQWREDLKKGDASAIKNEMEAIKSEMQKIAKMPEGAEKRAAQEQLAQRMNQLGEGLKQAASSPQMQAALQRAMEQLDMSKLDQMSKEALDAAQQSMSLSEQELDQLAQAMKDQQALEDALKSLQAAKQLADQQKLDGGQCGECKTMADYAALYQKLTQNNQVGPGMGPNGQPGAGGQAPENDESETSFKQERSPTQLSAGKTLLQWKTQELGPKGARPEDYQEAVKQVKQGVSEAISAEQVPPGYREAIQKYFDALPAK
ncbi:MAG: hypothetical protein ABMA13_01870 [Chthoniobacteraceae bacterium]